MKKAALILALIVLIPLVFCSDSKKDGALLSVGAGGGAARDLSGNFGLEAGGPFEAAGDSLRFDGSGFVKGQATQASLKELTFEAWVNADAVFTKSPDAVVFMAGKYALGLTVDEREGSGGLNAYINDSGLRVVPFEAGRWHHVALVYDGGVRIYLNGRLAKTGEAKGKVEIKEFYIGGDGRQNFHGTLRGLKLHRRALGKYEVRRLYLEGPQAVPHQVDEQRPGSVPYLAALIALLIPIVFVLKRTGMLQRDAGYLFLFGYYVMVYVLQVNLYPFEKYPGWDQWWGDVLTAGRLLSIRNALAGFEFPHIDPFTNFGYNIGGDHIALRNPLYLLVFLFPPEKVMLVNQVFFMWLAAAGAYLYLNRFTGSRLMSFLGGLAYISIPFVTGQFYFRSGANMFYALPLFLHLVHEAFEFRRLRDFVFIAVFSAFTVGSSGFFSLIVVPATCAAYSFLIAWRYYGHGLMGAAKRAAALLLLVVASVSFYAVPLVSNLKSTAPAGLAAVSGIAKPEARFIDLGSFLEFFRNFGLESLLRPVEGSALTLYVPAFCYFAALFALFFKRAVFQRGQAAVAGALLFAGALMFLVSALYHSPALYSFLLRSSGQITSYLRYNINLIPFAAILSSVVCISAINGMRPSCLKFGLYALIVVSSLAADYALLYRHPSVINTVGSSNVILFDFFGEPLKALTAVNFVAALLFIFAGPSFGRGEGGARPAFIVVSVCVFLVAVSLYNESRGFNREGLVRNSYRPDNYLKRKSCIDALAPGRYDADYRTLFAGEGRIVPDSGRDWRLIAETELHVAGRERALFSYREFAGVYTGFLRGTFAESGWYRRTNIFPPLSGEVARNTASMRLMGVRYVVSAGREIQSTELEYKGMCMSEDGPSGIADADDEMRKNYSEGGPLYVYELKDPMGVAFLADFSRRLDLPESLKVIYENKEHPWLKGIVYLEEPHGGSHEEPRGGISSPGGSAAIKRQKYNSFDVEVSAPGEKFLVVSFLYRPNYKAYIEGMEVKIYRAYGGLMCVNVPAGKHTVSFKYRPYDAWLGILLSSFALVLPFGLRRLF